ncbi:2'-5'-oligoadenylate synthase-like protein [Dipodomys spectabilis]|uniref:2'-5'-oligoadenylate synthase-like protein n=1 Tax=Dipodomys spectabilis TaxID=105255 RepID=UPI001C53FB0D|nr:2'-5'-oligoadenylate synthase-like protein [Dipodomys spectabilis]
MELSRNLYETPGDMLGTFLSQDLQPQRVWKEEIQDVWHRIEGFFLEQCFRDELVLDQKVKVLKVVKGGSSGKGTILNQHSDVDMVLFLSCFSSFKDQAQHRKDIIDFIKEKLERCGKSLAYNISVVQHREGKRTPRSLTLMVQPKESSDVMRVDVLPAFDALGSFNPNSKPAPEIYENLITSEGHPGEFSSSFTELQRHFVKSRPVKLKNLLLLVKHWYLQYVKHKYRAPLPPKYALELLTIYAWETGTGEGENFKLEEGLIAVMNLLRNYENICIYWTKYYDFQNEVVGNAIKQQLKSSRPIILDPADPTNNLGRRQGWAQVAEEAGNCLRQVCCLQKVPRPGWQVQPARDMPVTVKQRDMEAPGASGSRLINRIIGAESQLERSPLKKGGVYWEAGECVAIYDQPAVVHSTEMALAQELYSIPASRLDSFVSQWLQPRHEWKEEVLEAVRTVEQFLRQECFQGDRSLGQEVQVLKVVKVGSFGNGTVLRNETDVELVVFLSCFHSFGEEAKIYQAIKLMQRSVWCSKDLLALGLRDARMEEVPSALVLTMEPINVTIMPAFRALGPSVQPPTEVYVRLIQACRYPGNFSPSFGELQRNFVKHRPTKLKSLLRLVKHWYYQYVKAKCPRANLPPLYALELLTVYAWEEGTKEENNFRLEEGLTTVMELLQEYELICIHWTKFYSLQNPIIGDCVRKQLKKQRPIILDPADPTHNVAGGYRWDIVAQRASQCLKQDCCYDIRASPVPSWTVQTAPDIQVTVKQWGHSDLILWVNPYESIKKVKERICRSRGYLGLQRLSFQEPGSEPQVLSSHCSLAFYGIFCSTHICLLDTVSPEFQVFVKNPDGESHAYAVHPYHPIQSLKQQIEDRLGLGSGQQQLEFRGHVLQDWFDFAYYGIQDSVTLTLSKKKAEKAPIPRA